MHPSDESDPGVSTSPRRSPAGERRCSSDHADARWPGRTRRCQARKAANAVLDDVVLAQAMDDDHVRTEQLPVWGKARSALHLRYRNRAAGRQRVPRHLGLERRWFDRARDRHRRAPQRRGGAADRARQLLGRLLHGPHDAGAQAAVAVRDLRRDRAGAAPPDHRAGLRRRPRRACSSPATATRWSGSMRLPRRSRAAGCWPPRSERRPRSSSRGWMPRPGRASEGRQRSTRGLRPVLPARRSPNARRRACWTLPPRSASPVTCSRSSIGRSAT